MGDALVKTTPSAASIKNPPKARVYSNTTNDQKQIGDGFSMLPETLTTTFAFNETGHALTASVANSLNKDAALINDAAIPGMSSGKMVVRGLSNHETEGPQSDTIPPHKIALQVSRGRTQDNQPVLVYRAQTQIYQNLAAYKAHQSETLDPYGSFTLAVMDKNRNGKADHGETLTLVDNDSLQPISHKERFNIALRTMHDLKTDVIPLPPTTT